MVRLFFLLGISICGLTLTNAFRCKNGALNICMIRQRNIPYECPRSLDDKCCCQNDWEPNPTCPINYQQIPGSMSPSSCASSCKSKCAAKGSDVNKCVTLYGKSVCCCGKIRLATCKNGYNRVATLLTQSDCSSTCQSRCKSKGYGAGYYCSDLDGKCSCCCEEPAQCPGSFPIRVATFWSGTYCQANCDRTCASKGYYGDGHCEDKGTKCSCCCRRIRPATCKSGDRRVATLLTQSDCSSTCQSRCKSKGYGPGYYCSDLDGKCSCCCEEPAQCPRSFPIRVATLWSGAYCNANCDKTCKAKGYSSDGQCVDKSGKCSCCCKRIVIQPKCRSGYKPTTTYPTARECHKSCSGNCRGYGGEYCSGSVCCCCSSRNCISDQLHPIERK